MQTRAGLLFVLLTAAAVGATSPTLSFDHKWGGHPQLSLSQSIADGTLRPDAPAPLPDPPAAPMASARPTPPRNASRLPLIEPRMDVDFRMVVKAPDPQIDFKMLVKEPQVPGMK